MSNLTRLHISYDTEADADLHELIQSIPTKRRSERLRHLIRLGHATEQGTTAPQQNVLVEQEFVSKPKTEGQRKHRLKFSPEE